MSWKVLLSAPRMLRDYEVLKAQLDATGWDITIARDIEQRLDEDQLIALAADADAAMCGGDMWTARVFDACPKLKAVCKWGTGIDAVDQEAAAERGIAVRNVPDAFSVPVAETVLGLMLSFARNIPWLDQHTKAGEWKRIDGFSLAESSLGIIGVGNIGRTLARRAAAFGMTVYGHDPREVPPQFIDETRIQMVGLDALLATCDFVSLNCDLNPSSYHLMNDDRFAQMKPGSYLINTSRGKVVDQKALVRALESKRLAGAGIDVFEDEPVTANDAITGFDNVLLSPHLAQASPRACARVHQIVINNLTELLAASSLQPGETRPTAVPAGAQA